VRRLLSVQTAPAISTTCSLCLAVWPLALTVGTHPLYALGTETERQGGRCNIADAECNIDCSYVARERSAAAVGN